MIRHVMCWAIGTMINYVYSKKKQSVQLVHIQRCTKCTRNCDTVHASPSSVQGSAQEIVVVRNLETLGNALFLAVIATSNCLINLKQWSCMCLNTPD